MDSIYGTTPEVTSVLIFIEPGESPKFWDYYGDEPDDEMNTFGHPTVIENEVADMEWSDRWMTQAGFYKPNGDWKFICGTNIRQYVWTGKPAETPVA